MNTLASKKYYYLLEYVELYVPAVSIRHVYYA